MLTLLLLSECYKTIFTAYKLLLLFKRLLLNLNMTVSDQHMQ